MKIGEFSRQLGLTPPTVRFYETLGLIPRAPRASGSRSYDRKALDHLRAVLALKRVKFTLSEIKGLLAGGKGANARELWGRRARAKLSAIDREISELRAVRSMLEQSLDCECRADPEQCKLISSVERSSR